ncbi:MAG: M48 family metallopeptidase [Pseudomonadota bacterium]|nr:M48 family metallopeptidase [Pseudomonadota bacterium]
MNDATLLLTLVLAVTAFRIFLAWRQARHVTAHRERVPPRFADRISLQAHQRAADYTVAKSRLTMISLLIEAVLALALTLGSGITWLSTRIAGHFGSSLLQGLALFAAVAVIGGLIELPQDLYRTFVLEQRFGFNRTTPLQWLKDQGLGIALALAIGLPLGAAVLWMMDALGARWWLWAWLAWMAFNVLMLAIYPTWIAPLFNRFTPLADDGLRTRVESLMRKCGFHADGLFVMDGSRRSAHGNAYFTGFGRTKRVVFFDTLLGSLQIEEIEAVLAHELGHFARRHVLQRIVLLFLASLAVLALLGHVGNDPQLRAALAIAPGDAPLLVFVSLVLPFLLFPLQPLMSAWSRRHEFEADAYAAMHADPASLASALVKLYHDNASSLTPDPLHSAIYDSHPPALTRIGRLDRLTHA